jgi:hypothetical protein
MRKREVRVRARAGGGGGRKQSRGRVEGGGEGTRGWWVTFQETPTLAWVRCGVEFPPVFVHFLALFPFLPFSAIHLARTRNSVCICPICINALGLRETPSRPVLHNNALSLRESTSRLGLHNNALDCVNPHHDLVCITMPLICVKLRLGLICKNVLSLGYIDAF